MGSGPPHPPNVSPGRGRPRAGRGGAPPRPPFYPQSPPGGGLFPPLFPRPRLPPLCGHRRPAPPGRPGPQQAEPRYLGSHLPDAVDELQEDGGALVVAVVPVSVANPLGELVAKRYPLLLNQNLRRGQRTTSPTKRFTDPPPPLYSLAPPTSKPRMVR